ncbi:MAG: FtsX-like permease family protein, partial [Bacteroidota bacterium]
AVAASHADVCATHIVQLSAQYEQVFATLDSTALSRYTALEQNLLQIPEVELVSFSNDAPLSGSTWKSNFRYGSRPEDEEFHISMKFTDDNYQKTYGLRMVAGEYLAPSDTMRQVVLNETAVRKLQISHPAEVIGEYVGRGRKKLKIVGVVEDFHSHSFHTEHEPLMMTTLKDYYWSAGVKIRPGNIGGTVAAINQVFDRMFPEQVFEGRFLDASIDRFYESDNRLSATCKGFGLLAILISCLGLFGLAAHAAAQRIKEIGIRKVLGASIPSIVGLLSKDFIRLVLFALVVAAPLAWYFMTQWLNEFEYRVDIRWPVFLVAGGLAVAIAFLTVSWQAIRAALSNPVKSLKDE